MFSVLPLHYHRLCEIQIYKKMKAYRKPELTLPEPFEPVLVHADESGIAYIAYYDDGYWFEAHTSQQIDGVQYWAPIPILPYE
jgi:hypothetical protein